MMNGCWWWQWVALGRLVLVVGVVAAASTPNPPADQVETSSQKEEWSHALVEVSLTRDHAGSDAHGHSHIRVTAPNSILKVTMEQKHYHFHLKPTSWLVAPGATISHVGMLGTVGDYLPLGPRPCLYLAHPVQQGSAGPGGTVSLCHSDGARVILMMEREIVELLPRPERQDQPTPAHKRGDPAYQYTHLVKRHTLPAVMDKDCHNDVSCSHSPNVPPPIRVPDISQVMIDPTNEDVKRVPEVQTEPLLVELGLFLDQALLQSFSKYIISDQEMVDLVLGLVNNAQAMFYHPSLGRKVDLLITHLRLLKKQPEDLPTHRGNRVSLLKSFCNYNQRNNDPEDSSPSHWDIGVYLSGLNFFTQNEQGVKDSVTMGLAYTGGVCKPNLSCLINELGVVNYRGRPYPSSGALSSYVLAHEIGHSLGLRHDGISNACNSSGFIMAAGRGLRGATTWSSCAREKILRQGGSCLREGGATGLGSEWNHSVFRGLPGQKWDATAQCQLFLKDKDAGVPDLGKMNEICASVTCVSPKRISTYLAGPALEGTHCGGKNWCLGGLCVPWGKDQPKEVVVGGWGPWTHGDCTSGCVVGATGHKVSRRVCDSPPAKNSVEGCVGSEVRVSLCPDDKVCGVAPRKKVNQLASELCQVVSSLKPEIDAVGRQLSYSEDMAWQACAIYCQKKNTTSLWTPRYEFKDLPHIATHFPDGTPCNSGQYVCLNRACVPKGMMVASQRGRNGALPPDAGVTESDSSKDYEPIDVDDLFY